MIASNTTDYIPRKNKTWSKDRGGSGKELRTRTKRRRLADKLEIAAALAS